MPSSKSTPSNVYPNRFHRDYLGFLEEQLSPDNLKKNALFKEKKTEEGKFERCISIDFCGLAATTLFSSSIAHEVPNFAETTSKRSDIAEAFRTLLKKETLAELNTEGYYVRVRFCFAYLYADYPVCLMKAEKNEIWDNLIDASNYQYYISKPLNTGEFNGSHIRIAQNDSLTHILHIIQDNDKLIITGGAHVQANTLQVRFSTIPSGICVLIINNTAFCDPYMYAKLDHDRHLRLNYPVLVLDEKNLEMKDAYISIQKHFKYLWKHDLTLFCSDATNFKSDYKEGLLELLSPEQIIGPGGTNWGHKEKRIWEQKEQRPGKVLEKTPLDIEKISEWKANLNKKLSLCTKKIKGNPDHEKPVYIEIGMRHNFFYFKIEIKNPDLIFEYLQSEGTLLYCVIAHYSYSLLNMDKKPNLHEIHPGNKNNHYKLKREIIEQLNHYDLHKNGSGKDAFDILFSLESGFKMTIPPENIDFDFKNINKIAEAKYSITHKGVSLLWSCLDFNNP